MPSGHCESAGESTPLEEVIELSPRDAMGILEEVIGGLRMEAEQEGDENPAFHFVQQVEIDGIWYDAVLLGTDSQLNHAFSGGVELLLPADPEINHLDSPTFLARTARIDEAVDAERALYRVSEPGIEILKPGTPEPFIEELLAQPNLLDPPVEPAESLVALATHLGADLRVQPFRRAQG